MTAEMKWDLCGIFTHRNRGLVWKKKKYEAIVEAILFTMGESVELERIAKTLELDTERTKKIIEHLMQRYEDDGVGVKIMEMDVT